MLYRHLFSTLWVGWALYWWAVSIDVKTTVRQESLRSRLLYICPLIVAVLLLWWPDPPFPLFSRRFLPVAAWPFWVGAALCAAGLLFTVWARLHLGRNWSATVTIKRDHELVTSGPYALVRHPIYTGILLAFIGSATAQAEVRGILAVVLAFWSFWYKLRHEECWMYDQFGEAYRVYSQRVAPLVPFVF